MENVTGNDKLEAELKNLMEAKRQLADLKVNVQETRGILNSLLEKEKALAVSVKQGQEKFFGVVRAHGNVQTMTVEPIARSVAKAKPKKATPKTKQPKKKACGIPIWQRIETLLGKHKDGLEYAEIAKAMPDVGKPTLSVILTKMKGQKSLKRKGKLWLVA